MSTSFHHDIPADNFCKIKIGGLSWDPTSNLDTYEVCVLSAI